MKIIFLYLVIIAAVAGLGEISFADEVSSTCECATVSVEDAAQEADAIFIGNVEKIDESGGVNEDGEKKIAVHFKTQHLYKGPPNSDLASEVVLHTVLNQKSCSGFNFELNKGYLVFAHMREDGNLGTRLCSRTNVVNAALNDINIIDALFNSENQANE